MINTDRVYKIMLTGLHNDNKYGWHGTFWVYGYNVTPKVGGSGKTFTSKKLVNKMFDCICKSSRYGIDLQIAEREVWKTKALHAKRIKNEQLIKLRGQLKTVKKEENNKVNLDAIQVRYRQILNEIRDMIGEQKFLEINVKLDRVDL